MPSATHQGLIALLLDSPEVLTSVLAPVAEPGVPGEVRIRPASAAFSNLTPPSYHADLVLRVEDARGRLRDLFIVEIQLRRDRRKHITWPIYLTAARAEVGLGCPVTLVVVALTPGMARWCAQPIALDRRGSVVVPLVLGPEIIPRIVDIEAARARPELAVLSAVVHADSEDAARIAAAALIACRTLDSEYVSLYADMVEARLDPVARRAVEKLMEIHGYQLQTAHARKHFAAGEKKGRKEALASMLTIQLEQRFGALPAYAARAIAAADVDALLELVTRVLAAASLEDVVPRPARRRERGKAAGTRSRSHTGARAAGTRPRSRARATAVGTRPRSRAGGKAAGRTRSR